MEGMIDVDPTAKLVALVLADCANVKDNGIAYPSVATIARRACITERPAQAHLQALVTAGWLTIEGPNHGGRGMTTRYRLNLPRLRATASKTAKNGAADSGVNRSVDNSTNGAANSTHNAKERVLPAALKGAVQCTKTPLPAAPEPEVEPERTTRARANATNGVSTLRDVLNRNGLKAAGPQRQPENPAPRRKPATMSQAAQLAYIASKLPKEGKA